MSTTEFQILTKRLDRIERILIHDKKKKPLWVKVGTITERTGWNREDMRQARLNGLVKYQDETINGVKHRSYDLNSIEERLLKPVQLKKTA